MEKIFLFQKNSNGKIKQWTIKVEDNNNTADIVITTGLIDGKQQEVRTTITEGKNIGKKNSTTYYTQAIADAQTEINKKIKKGYVYSISDIKDSTETASEIKAVMKGGKYHPKGKEKNDGSKNLKELKIEGEKIFISKKLDGLRCQILINEENEIKFFSSSGDPMYQFPHIEKAILELWEENKKKLNIDSIILDGEIYSHNKEMLPFEKVSGLVRKKYRYEEDLRLEKYLSFFIFDYVSDKGFKERYDLIKHFINNEEIRLVECYEIIADEKIIEMYFNQWLNEGFEGLMIRLNNIPYEHKRGKQLIKYKPECDDEFQIVGFKQSITGDTLGSIEFNMNDNSNRTFFATGIGFSDEQCKEIWNNKDSYIGKWMTVKYLEMTEQGLGVPRHPKFLRFREGRSID